MLPGIAANSTDATFGALDAKLTELHRQKKDFISDTRKLSLGLRTLGGENDRDVMMEVDGQGEYPILNLAHDQIGSHVNIPSKYYDRMLTSAPGLLIENVNHWLHDTEKPIKRMVRTLNGNMRAFLSNAYQRIENEEIAAAAFPVLRSDPSLRVVSAQVTEKRLYIQAVTTRITLDVKKDDAVQAGVIISNSEVGAGSVLVAPVVWRLRCLNGMISPDSRFRAYHVGRRIETNEALWRADTQQADDRAVLLKVRDMTLAALSEIEFSKRVDKMRDLAELEVTGDPAEAVEVLAAKVGVSDTEKGGILSALIKGKDLSAWGLLNAVTFQAHDARNYDRAVEFEEAGGKLLDLSPKDWLEVLEAKKPAPKKKAA